jgi:WD40 repeat protein
MTDDDLRKEQPLPWIQAAGFSADGKILITGSSDGVLAAWDVGTGLKAGPFKRGAPIFTVCVSPNGAFWAVGDAYGWVTIRDAQSREELSAWRAFDSAIMALDISPDGNWLATGAREPGDTTLRVWRFGQDRVSPPVEAFSDHRHVTAVYAVAFSSDSRRLAAGGWTNSSYSGPVIYELDSGHRVASLIWECSRSLRFSPDGTILASGDEWGKASLWDIAKGNRLHEFEAHKGIVSALRFSPDGRRVASGSIDGTIKLWDVGSGSQCLDRTCEGIVLDVQFIGARELVAAVAAPGPKAPPQIVRLALD